MTLALLGALLILAVLLCVAFALPPGPDLNPARSFEVDRDDVRENPGRHAWPEADETLPLPLPPLGRVRRR